MRRDTDRSRAFKAAGAVALIVACTFLFLLSIREIVSDSTVMRHVGYYATCGVTAAICSIAVGHIARNAGRRNRRGPRRPRGRRRE